MLTILATPDSMVKFQGNRWWAEHGMICSEDRHGGYKVHTVRDILYRLRAINDMLGNTRKNNAYRPDELLAHRTYIEDMLKVCKIAQDQGRPEVPEARKQIIEEQRRASVVVPGVSF